MITAKQMLSNVNRQRKDRERKEFKEKRDAEAAVLREIRAFDWKEAIKMMGAKIKEVTRKGRTSETFGFNIIPHIDRWHACAGPWQDSLEDRHPPAKKIAMYFRKKGFGVSFSVPDERWDPDWGKFSVGGYGMTIHWDKEYNWENGPRARRT